MSAARELADELIASGHRSVAIGQAILKLPPEVAEQFANDVAGVAREVKHTEEDVFNITG